VSALYLVVCRLLELIVLVGRCEQAKELEILVLRHEVSILRRQVRQPRYEPHDRLLLAAFSRVLPRPSWSAFSMRPETLLHWHRRPVARSWTYPQRRPGRPPINRDVREVILRLARENPSWGYLRIVGELRKLGVRVSATSVRNILTNAGVPPAPQRDRQSWRCFLRAHGESILACDFCTVDTACSSSSPSGCAASTRWELPDRIRRLHVARLPRAISRRAVPSSATQIGVATEDAVTPEGRQAPEAQRDERRRRRSAVSALSRLGMA
jgi:hypothetical protein